MGVNEPAVRGMKVLRDVFQIIARTVPFYYFLQS